MTRRAPSFARAFTGRWLITEMYEWDEIDLGGSAHITVSGKDHGKLAFLAVDADLDVRYGSRDGAACAEFSWEGFDDGTAASGRGWALGGAGRLVGHIFIHKGDDQASSPNASDFFNSLLSGSLAPRAAVQLRSQPIGSADRRRFLQTAVTGRVSDAGQARDRPGFMTHAESEMDISGCLRTRY